MPDWRDQVLYFVMTDRFAGCDPANNDQGAGEYRPGDRTRYRGGDLRGVQQRLACIRGLGATGVWITPPATRRTGAHAPPRPVPRPSQPPFDQSDPRDPAQRAAGIYHWTPDIGGCTVPEQERRFQMGGLDDLNTDNPVVRRALRDSCGFWVREVGVDAFRVDAAFYVAPGALAWRLHLDLHRITTLWSPPNGFDHVNFTVYIELPGVPGRRHAGCGPRGAHRQLHAAGGGAGPAALAARGSGVRDDLRYDGGCRALGPEARACAMGGGREDGLRVMDDGGVITLP